MADVAEPLSPAALAPSSHWGDLSVRIRRGAEYVVIPLLALGISALWGIYGAIYFIRSSKAKGKAVLLTAK